MTPGKSGPPVQRRTRRFWRISSLTVRRARSGTPEGDSFSAPNVWGKCFMSYAIVLLGEWGRGTGEGFNYNGGKGIPSSVSETHFNLVVVEHRPVSHIRLAL